MKPSRTNKLEKSEIDRMVYELYGLTEAEIRVVDPERIGTGGEG